MFRKVSTSNATKLPLLMVFGQELRELPAHDCDGMNKVKNARASGVMLCVINEHSEVIQVARNPNNSGLFFQEPV